MAKKSLLFQFTQAQLNAYIKDDNSCVKCVPSKMHIGFPPYGLDNFKECLLAIISKSKIGTYDADSRGIVLDVRNIKLEGTMSMIRFDSPELHLNIQAKFYVFQPHLGALLKGTVKHISKRHVSALIYNVFNVSIRLNGDFKKKLQVNKEISFRVKNFDLQNVLPYIEGELVDSDESGDSGISGAGDHPKAVNSKKTFSKNSSSSSSSSDEDSDDEKAFKNLVIKTEPTPKPNVQQEASSSSSSDSDSSDDEADATVLPKPLVKQEGIKKEKPSNAIKTPAAQSAASSSSSDESSEEEESPAKKLPVPIPVVKTEPKKKPVAPTISGVTPSKSSGSSSSDSDSDAADKPNATPAFPVPKKFVKQEKKDSTSDSDSSSDDEEFKIPMPKLSQEGGQVVIKREMTPTQRVKHESSSSASETESGTKAKKTPAAKKPSQASPVKTPAKSPSKSPVKKTKAVAKEDPLPVPIVDVKKEKAKKPMRVSFAADVPKPDSPKKKKTPAPAKSSDGSSSDDDDMTYKNTLNLKSSIQNLVSQIYTTKVSESESEDSKKKSATSRKRKSATNGKVGENGTNADGETTPAKKKKSAASKSVSQFNPDIDISKIFDDDVLSSTRLDATASPAVKAKKKKKVTE